MLHDLILVYSISSLFFWYFSFCIRVLQTESREYIHIYYLLRELVCSIMEAEKSHDKPFCNLENQECQWETSAQLQDQRTRSRWCDSKPVAEDWEYNFRSSKAWALGAPMSESRQVKMSLLSSILFYWDSQWVGWCPPILVMATL